MLRSERSGTTVLSLHPLLPIWVPLPSHRVILPRTQAQPQCRAQTRFQSWLADSTTNRAVLVTALLRDKTTCFLSEAPLLAMHYPEAGNLCPSLMRITAFLIGTILCTPHQGYFQVSSWYQGTPGSGPEGGGGRGARQKEHIAQACYLMPAPAYCLCPMKAEPCLEDLGCPEAEFS